MQKLTTIEAARGIAASIVVIFHATHHFQKVTGTIPLHSAFEFGHAAVDFFFVLSGFIIFYINAKDIGVPQAGKKYIYRRLIRIYPIFWVTIILFLIWLLMSGKNVDIFEKKFLIDILLLPGESIVGVSWSLRYEIIFYTFFLILILNRKLGIAVVTIWLGYIVYTKIFGDGRPGVLANFFNLQFFMGACVAMILRSARWEAFLTKIPSLGALVAGLAIFGATATLNNMGVITGHGDVDKLGYGLGAALIVLGLVRLEHLGHLSAPRFLVFLGSVSYSIYLVHLLGNAIGNQFLVRTGIGDMIGMNLSLLVTVIFGIGTGIVVGSCIEMPMLKILRKRGSFLVFREAARARQQG